MVPADMAQAPAADLAAHTRLGRLPTHGQVRYVKDLAVTVLILLALPWLVHRLVTRPHSVLGGGPNVSVG
jgi:hypothetical protein